MTKSKPVSKSAKPRIFYNGIHSPDEYGKSVTVSELPGPPPSLRSWPLLVPEKDTTSHLLMKAIKLARAIITSNDGINAMAALALKLHEIAPDDIVVDGADNPGLGRAFPKERWEQRVARNFAEALRVSWPDVMIDEEMQWPTNFANIERRPWSGDFEPVKFLIRLNAPVSDQSQFTVPCFRLADQC